MVIRWHKMSVNKLCSLGNTNQTHVDTLPAYKSNKDDISIARSFDI